MGYLKILANVLVKNQERNLKDISIHNRTLKKIYDLRQFELTNHFLASYFQSCL